MTFHPNRSVKAILGKLLPGAVLLLCAGLHPALAVPVYTVTPLPGLTPVAGGITSTSLNKWGQVVGVRAGNPVLWTPKLANGLVGTVLDLSGQVGYPANARSGNKGVTTALNDAGEVVGNAYVTSGGDANGVLSWLWIPTYLNSTTGKLHGNKGAVTVFATINGLAEYPSSLNNGGQITGHGSSYQPELFTPVTPNTGTGSWVSDSNVGVTDFFINNAGQVGGGVYGGSLPNYQGWDFAFVQNGFPPVSGSSIISSPQWSLTSNADALAINQLGDVIVDTVPTSLNEVHGYLVKNGVVSDVGGGSSSFLSAINDSDMITGARTEGPGAYAFLNTNGTAYDLQSLVPATVNGQTFTVAPQPGPVAINDLGQILTTGGDGVGDALFLLTPAALIVGKQPGLTSTTPKPAGPNLFTRKITVTNGTGAVLTGPVSVVFGNLPAGVSVVGAIGTTNFVGPAGSPYVDVSATDMGLLATASVTVTFSAPSAAAITYTGRVVAGPASR